MAGIQKLFFREKTCNGVGSGDCVVVDYFDVQTATPFFEKKLVTVLVAGTAMWLIILMFWPQRRSISV
jgi:hypothetical protein